MSRHSLFLSTFLLFSTAVFAQHTTTTTPSAPPPAPPSPPPSIHVSAPAPAPAPSPAPSVSHSVPSAPSTVSPSATHPSPTHSSPEARVANESSPHKEVASEHPGKEADPELRHHICHGEHCVKNPVKTACPGANCTCPAGQTGGPGGCVATVATATPETHPACGAGSVWNGNACQVLVQCPPGQVRRGVTCQSDCTAITSQAYGMVQQVRNARQNRDDACGADSTGQVCSQATAAYDSAVAEYRSLYGSAPSECRGSLVPPDSV